MAVWSFIGNSVHLFAATSTDRGVVFMCDDGAPWFQFSSPGVDNQNVTSVTRPASWNGQLDAGTRGNEGGEFWTSSNPVLFCGGSERRAALTIPTTGVDP